MNIDLDVAALIQQTMDKDVNGCKFTLVDHHDTNMNVLNKYEWATIQTIGADGDPISAAKLLYLLFEDSIDRCYRKELSKFVNLVSLYDTYLWLERNLQEPKDLHILMSLYGREKFVKKMIDNISTINIDDSSGFKLSEMDTFILDMEKNKIKRYMDEKLSQVKKYNIFDQNVGIVFSDNPEYRSELGNLICTQLKCDVGLMIDISKREVSYRTTKSDFNLGEWVKEHYKGGGHIKSAGSQISEDIIKQLIRWIVSLDTDIFMDLNEFIELGLLLEVN